MKHREVFTTILITAICLCGMYVSTSLLYDNMFRAKNKSGEVEVGKIEKKNRSVERRFSDRLSWNNVQSGFQIYEGDIIRTDDSAGATISLNSNTIITMNEKSLIQIVSDNRGRQKLELFNGNINVEAVKEDVVVKHNGYEIEVKKGSSIATSENDEGVTTFSINEGNAVIVSDDGLSKVLNSGFEVSVDSTGKIVKSIEEKKAPAELLPPSIAVGTTVKVTSESEYDSMPSSGPNLRRVRLISPSVQVGAGEVEKNGSIVFKWGSVAGANAYICELLGEKIRSHVTIRDTSYAIDAYKIDNGSYTWRVEAVRTANGEIVQRGEIVEREINVNIPEPPKPIPNRPLETPK
jgi:hypothetical protein